MVNAKIITNHLVKGEKRLDIMHSSGYAQAQNRGSFGATGGESFEARQDINSRRKFVQGYNNSRIMNEFYGVQRARAQAGYGRYGGRDNKKTEVDNPMDVAMQRAKMSASGGRGASTSVTGVNGDASRGGRNTGANGIGATRPTAPLPEVRAPQIPNRRSGI